MSVRYAREGTQAAVTGVQRLAGFARTVDDLEVASAFYRDVLGFQQAESVPTNSADALMSRADAALSTPPGVRCRQVRLSCGAQRLNLVSFETLGIDAAPECRANDRRFQHFALVVDDMCDVWGRLHEHVDTISTNGPVTLPIESGGVTAWKFRDPAGHPLELLRFPSEVAGDSPNAARQRPSMPDASSINRIDHSAIVVTDIERSLAFHCGLLGLQVASRQCNRGVSQEQLDGLSAPIVEVVALEPEALVTPHLELLSYSHPAMSMPAVPTGQKALPGDRLLMEVNDLAGLLETLHEASIEFDTFCEPDIRAGEGDVFCAHGNTAWSDSSELCASQQVCAARVNDPDGHVLILFQRP